MIYTERVAPLRLGLICLILLAGLSACSDEKDEPREVSCRLNSDCAEGGVCVSGACVAQEPCAGESCSCTSAQDCPLGQRCDASTGMCMELDCLSDADCPLGDLCFQGQCLTDLDADRDRDGRHHLGCLHGNRGLGRSSGGVVSLSGQGPRGALLLICASLRLNPIWALGVPFVGESCRRKLYEYKCRMVICISDL